MAITIELPIEIEQELRREVPNLDDLTREQFLVANYRSGQLSTGDIAVILGLDTRVEAETWLAQRGVRQNYSLKDLEQDRENLHRLLGRE